MITMNGNVADFLTTCPNYQRLRVRNGCKSWSIARMEESHTLDMKFEREKFEKKERKYKL